MMKNWMMKSQDNNTSLQHLKLEQTERYSSYSESFKLKENMDLGLEKVPTTIEVFDLMGYSISNLQKFYMEPCHIFQSNQEIEHWIRFMRRREIKQTYIVKCQGLNRKKINFKNWMVRQRTKFKMIQDMKRYQSVLEYRFEWKEDQSNFFIQQDHQNQRTHFGLGNEEREPKGFKKV
ncbi:unnamed protein product [Paramecium octaurelia]|uniref:Uncharacterized protein n=1 Tax=Paramecium octaurelia TaxID=43137 RepID=A0A8S1YM28_PAROT|nr:unnamed protein product [Paramecium octaurelia]